MWVVSYPFVIFLIFTSIYDATSAYYGDLHWVRFNSARDPVPTDAVVGGYENGMLYIVRAGHEGSMTPGKFSVSLRRPYISWGFASHLKEDLEILCGRNYDWVSASKGSVPFGAFVAGRSENSLKETLYIGKASYGGYVIPGKVQPSHKTLYIAYGNKEIPIDYYEVLVVPQKKNPDIILDGPKTVIKGYSVNIECKIIQGIPTPTITWQFKASGSSTFVSKSGSSSVLYLGTVDARDEGTYKCIASNYAGDVYRTTHVTVLIPPTILQSSSKVYTVVEGKDAQLQIPCTVTGSPKPIITWKANPSATYHIQDGTLVINNPKVADTGDYKCEAANNAGSTYATFKVVVHQAPKLLGEVTKTVKKGQSLNIECRVIKGVPKPTFTWQFKAKDTSKFEVIAGSSHLLTLTNVDINNEGNYKCIAHNVVDTDEHIIALTVQFAPFITSGNSELYGLEGDVALRIPCKVVGVPKPTITWKINSIAITSNSRYSIIDGALIIKDPKQNDSKSYTCEARNELGLAKATFKATIDASLEDYGTMHEVNVLKGTTTKLKCGSADPSQSIRWFLEGVDSGLKGQFFDVANVDETLDGNYTCRVSDMNGAHTETYVVTVGYPPEFNFDQDDQFFDWSGSEQDDLDCDVTAKPPANVVWSFNGKVLSGQNSSHLAIPGKWGHYTCNVSNIHGTIQRSFDVMSSKCLIRRKPKNIDTIPLIISSRNTWPVLDSTTDYLIVEPEDTVIFSCPKLKDEINSLQNMSRVNEISATCVKQDIFKVQDVVYKASDFECAQPVNSEVLNKHEKCLGDTSELVRVGHEVHGFLETYEVCFDVSKKMTLYSRAVMSKSNRGVGHTYSWYKHPALGFASANTAHTCTHSISSCCYTKAQLVNARDVSDGPPQKSTFIDPLNAVPLWVPCDVPHGQSPWASIEDTVRSRLDSYDQFVVWSGIHKIENVNGSTIPRYVWKVVRFAADDSLAMIYVNGPSPSAADILCKNICADNKIIPWIHEHDDHTYCCQVDEFLSAFGLSATTVGKEALDNNIAKN